MKHKTRKELAEIGESAAANLLRARGYRLRERNYRCPAGEIDIIAEHEGDLVFVEVKARTRTEQGEPSENVTPDKQRRLAQAAASYLAYRVGREVRCRYDIVEVLLEKNGRVREMRLLPGAF
jgi:putative endonuclease